VPVNSAIAKSKYFSKFFNNFTRPTLAKCNQEQLIEEKDEKAQK